MSNNEMERIFQITAVILIGVAAYFLWCGNSDGLFIAGVLGAVCFFLSIRFQVKERMEQREFEEWEAAEKTGEDAGNGEILEINLQNDEISVLPAIETNPQSTDNRQPTSNNHL